MKVDAIIVLDKSLIRTEAPTYNPTMFDIHPWFGDGSNLGRTLRGIGEHTARVWVPIYFAWDEIIPANILSNTT